MFFMGAIILLEKSQRVTSLFAVSPLKESEYIGSKVLSISLIAVFVAGVAPVLAGVAIHFAVPFIEKILIRYTGIPEMLSPYYGLLDIFLASITPTMYCFIVAIVILEERDDHIDRYLFVTSLGRKGYYISRIFIPALLAFLVTVSLLPIFCLSALLLVWHGNTESDDDVYAAFAYDRRCLDSCFIATYNSDTFRSKSTLSEIVRIL